MKVGINRTEQLAIRATAEQARLLRMLSAARDVSMSHMVGEWIMREAQSLPPAVRALAQGEAKGGEHATA